MSDDRVETRVQLVGRGIGATPESIDQLRKRSRELEKLSRKKPTKKFGDLLEGDDEEAVEEPAPEGDAAPPGPRPGLVHPSQRQVYGRENRKGESVILKG
ncbi:MAG: hypothetical protein AAF654_02700 [Myxococcota bacterium]